MVVQANVYFDESGTHANSRVMALAGYWFEAEQARRFSRDWAKDLRRFGLSAAHMTDCALGFGEYKNLKPTQRIESEKLLIGHIKRRSRFSVAVCVGQEIYNSIFRDIPGAPTAYTFMVLLCVNKIAHQIELMKYKGRVAYFFESGHQHASEANKFMNFIQTNTNPAVDYHRYAGHSFVDKKISLPLQAADMLAWQSRHYLERFMDGHETPRKDFVALARPQDLHTVITAESLQALADLYKNAGAIFGPHLVDPQARAESYRLMEGILGAHGLNSGHADAVARQIAQEKRRRRLGLPPRDIAF